MRKAGDILKSYFSEKEIKKGKKYHLLFSNWEDIVGIQLGSHTHIRDIQNGSLVVEVDHPGWMQKMQMKEKRILSGIQKRYPELEVVSLTIRLNDQQYSRKEETAKPRNQERGDYEEFKSLFESFKKTVLDREKEEKS